MKKLLALFLAICLLTTSFTACSDTRTSAPFELSEVQVSTTEPTETDATEASTVAVPSSTPTEESMPEQAPTEPVQEETQEPTQPTQEETQETTQPTQEETQAATQPETQQETQKATAPETQPETAAPAAASGGTLVWIPETGTKYHSKSSCSGMKDPTQVTEEQAIAWGYEPCKRCH